ncbi:MAG: methyltransferase type 11 [Verrucomicrobiales bacterium]|nr:methyltransferase type 11 [Verrucomicrobiales bacterium]
MPRSIRLPVQSLLICLISTLSVFAADVLPAKSGSDYETRADHDPNGIGVFYMGREIAHVMGHQAADWLERPNREEEENTTLMVKLLSLKPGDKVADIGAGTGYVTRKMAPKILPGGSVYAVEIQQEMLDILTNKLAGVGITNVVPVLGTIEDPKLPAKSLDMIIMVDVYHEFDHPLEMTRSMTASLKVGGRLVFVEYRLEDAKVPIKLVHKTSVEQIKKEMSIHPLKFVKSLEDLPWQHVIIFERTR